MLRARIVLLDLAAQLEKSYARRVRRRPDRGRRDFGHSSHLVFATSTMVGSACRTIPDTRLEDFACKSIGGKDAYAYTSRAIRSSYVSRRVVTRASPSFTNTTPGRGWPL